MPRIRPNGVLPAENVTEFEGELFSTLFRVEDEAHTYLARLAKEFPSEFARALRHVGWRIKTELSTTMMRESGAAGTRWPKRSLMHQYRRMDLLKAGGVSTKDGEWEHGKQFALKRRRKHVGNDEHSIPNAFNRWRGRTTTLRNAAAMGGRLSRAIRYRYYNDTMRVIVGAATPSAAKHLGAVQAGRRGSRGLLQFDGNQPITPAMRRAFWAAGVPLAKHKTSIEQPERQLVVPVYSAMKPHIQPIIEQRILDILQGKRGRR